MLSSDAARQMFWVCLMENGAAGGTYGANGIWQVNRRDAAYGPSPHGRSWGSQPWDEAMSRPGSAQVGLAKRFFARYPWQNLAPRPQAAAWADEQPAKDESNPSAVGTGTERSAGVSPAGAAGTAAVRCIIYVPRPRPIVVKDLAPGAEYSAGEFDPVSGEYSPGGTIKADANGTWRCPPPGYKHDWVVILEKR